MNKQKSEKLHNSRLFRKQFGATIAILIAGFSFLGLAITGFSIRVWSQEKLTLFASNADSTATLVTHLYEQEALLMVQTMTLSSALETVSSILDADVFLTDASGRVVACVHEIPPSPELSLPVHCAFHRVRRLPPRVAEQALHGNFSMLGDPDGAFGVQMLLAAEPYLMDGDVSGFVMIAQQVNGSAWRYIAGIMRLLLMSSLVVFIGLFAVVYVNTYRTVRPLSDMLSATRSYARGEFHHRVPIRTHDDLSDLAAALNTMAKDLEHLENSRRNFVANVSHELRTPMTTIGGFVEGMLDGVIPPEKHAHYLTIIHEEVQRLSRLVTGMLNLSRLEAGTVKIESQEVSLSDLLIRTALSFEQRATEKQLRFTGLEELPALNVYGDPGLLTQVLYNLIDNAVKFTPPGELISFSVRQEKKDLVLTVRNTGIEVPAEALSSIFERFYKLDPSRSLDSRNVGLGLYLCKTIALLHGGRITAETHPNATSFSLRLPLHS